MKNSFNAKRFWKYFQHDLLSTQKSNIGMLLLIMVLFPVLFYAVYMFFDALGNGGIDMLFSGKLSGPDGNTRLVIFIMLTGLFTILYPARAYGELTDKSKGSSWLMLPASRLEKFTSMVLITLIVVPVIYLIGHLGMDWILCHLDKSCGTSILQMDFNDTSVVSINSETMNETGSREVLLGGNGAWLCFAAIMETASMYLLGALIFRKWKVIGTMFSQFIIMMAITTILALAAVSLDGSKILDMADSFIADQAPYGDFWFNCLMNTILVIIVGGCLTWSWFRIKKLQH